MDKRGKNSVKFPPREEDRCSKNQLEDPAVQNKIQQYVDEAFKRVHDGFQREEVTNAIKEVKEIITTAPGCYLIRREETTDQDPISKHTLVSPPPPHHTPQTPRRLLFPLYHIGNPLFGVRPLPRPSFAGSIPGALLTQFVADNILALNSIGIFVASRFILGFFVTIGIGISSVFLTECSPIQCRGGTGMIIGLIKKAFIIELN
ncbi:hypothetical protein niasHT_010111 [Heterodera trifolii]|uniref:Uncharacterized protein n=1 Tax=Heterodera trifolii TaxID=157864 RepID=A0ABD2LWA9_9BILA